jgi:hypothetical protein
MALSGEYSAAQKGIGYLMDHRSEMGGYMSTQDTVVAFQAIKSYGVFPMDEMEVLVKMDGKMVRVIDLDDTNKDMTNIIDLRSFLSSSSTLTLTSKGSGIVMYQVFMEQYLPWDVIGEERPEEFDFRVTYDTTEIKVDDTIRASVNLTYQGDAAQVRMVLIDLRAPVGFSFIREEFESLDENGTIDFFEIKGRQCILYLEGLDKGVHIAFDYHLRADIVIESAAIQDVAVWDMYDTELRSEQPPVTVSSNE